MPSSIQAKVIEDSVSQAGARLTTLQLTYPRFIHSEFMTHRVFSRNASSSRAVPLSITLAQVRNEPALPVHWGANQTGMQARSELGRKGMEAAREVWQQAAIAAADYAERMHQLGVHKQVANRLLEPFLDIAVIVTATEWDNFYNLRAHADAQPEIQALAHSMRGAMSGSAPRSVTSDPNQVSSWHLPYILPRERDAATDPQQLVKLSAARCARVSYLTHDGQHPDTEKDLGLFARLVGSTPLHASPIEHQAYPLEDATRWSNNFRGWKQYREIFESQGLN